MQNILVDLKKLGLLILICLFMSPLFPYTETEASYSGSYFGGKVMVKESCTCSPGDYLLTISGPKGSSGTYLYSPLAGTKTYSRGTVKQGSYLLGQYSSGGSCLMLGTPCEPITASKGTIKFVGTSF
ncbi:MAG: hypothetical protein WC089_02945 [Candidatus Paceibacterota bacterium]